MSSESGSSNVPATIGFCIVAFVVLVFAGVNVFRDVFKTIVLIGALLIAHKVT